MNFISQGYILYYLSDSEEEVQFLIHVEFPFLRPPTTTGSPKNK